MKHLDTKKTMTATIMILPLLAGLPILAAADSEPVPIPVPPPVVKVTSFVRTQPVPQLSELCGYVTGLKPGHSAVVRIISDPQTNKPGFYQSLTGPDGRFCLTLFTYTGYAEAVVLDPASQPRLSEVAHATVATGEGTRN